MNRTSHTRIKSADECTKKGGGEMAEEAKSLKVRGRERRLDPGHRMYDAAHSWTLPVLLTFHEDEVANTSKETPKKKRQKKTPN